MVCTINAGSPDAPPASFEVSWKPTADGHEHVDQFKLDCGKRREATVWINDVIDQFSIRPDNEPCTVKLDAILLAVPRD
jgi:hypothetical protein